MLAEILTSSASWNGEQPLLTYIVPTELEDKICEGQLVAIPYGERLVEGIVWNILPDDEGICVDEENVATSLMGITGGAGLNEHVATPLVGVAWVGQEPAKQWLSLVVLLQPLVAKRDCQGQ